MLAVAGMPGRYLVLLIVGAVILLSGFVGAHRDRPTHQGQVPVP